jgi:hypothetical protein
MGIIPQPVDGGTCSKDTHTMLEQVHVGVASIDWYEGSAGAEPSVHIQHHKSTLSRSISKGSAYRCWRSGTLWLADH